MSRAADQGAPWLGDARDWVDRFYRYVFDHTGQRRELLERTGCWKGETTARWWPAYEELIWIEYLGQNISLAPELPALLGRYEAGVSLNAQNEYLGKTSMATVGFTQRYVKKFAAITRQTEVEIKDVGRKLGWPKKGQTVLPSMWFLSKKVGREKDYKFLYHATSRFVHFSAQEIYRRVWGTKGDVTISSRHFSRYWQDFAMCWGLRIGERFKLTSKTQRRLIWGWKTRS